MNHARPSSLLCVSLLIAIFAASCASTHDDGDVVPSAAGAVQPDGGGKTLDEETACEQLTAAEAATRKKLGCASVARQCPDYIRPAGGEACFVYDQASVDGCATLYDTFVNCDAFDQHPCLLAAESNCGAAGNAGVGGAAGSAGAGGQSGGRR